MNVSRQTIQDKQFPGFVQKHIEIGQLPADMLAFEFAQGVASSDAPEVQAFAEDIENIGCGVIMCDFDASEGATEALHRLKPQFVKISLRLLKNLRPGSREYDELSKARTACQAMGIKTSAERVEEKAVIDELRAIGIDYVQGFSLGAPKPLE